MQKGLLFSILLFCTQQAFPQNPIPDLKNQATIADKLKTLKQACDSLNAIEKYNDVQKVARYALQLTPVDDLANLSLFNYHIGVAIESFTNRDSAIYYHETALAYAKKAAIPKRIRTAYQRLLFLYHSAGNEAKADKTAIELQHILDTTKNKIWQYEILSFIGNYQLERAQYEQSIRSQLKSIEIQKKLLKESPGKVDSSDVGISLLNVANIYCDIQQPAKAIEYITPARQLLVNYAAGITYYYKNYVTALVLLRQPAAALMYYDSLTQAAKAEAAGSTGWGDRIAADLVFADYYLSLGKTDSALLFTGRAHEKAPAFASTYLRSQIDYITGKVYAARKEYNKALPLLKNAAPITRNAGLQVHASLLQTLAQCYAATGQWEQAYMAYEQYAPLRDSLYTEASKKSIADAEAKFQNKEKQQQIETKNMQLSAARKQRTWLLSGLGLLALSALLLFIIYRNKKRSALLLDEKNKALALLNDNLEEANRTKAKLFGIISHDLRSPISQVYQFLKLQQLNPTLLTEEQKKELSHKIQTATGSLLETMEDLLLWSKTQMNEFSISLQLVDLSEIITSCKKLLQLNSDAKHITYENSIDRNEIVTDPYYVQTIVRNLLQNAIKASPDNGLIRTGTMAEKDGLILFIENQGASFTQEDYLQVIHNDEYAKTLDGLGLRLTQELSVKINASVYFTFAGESGTRANLFLPYR